MAGSALYLTYKYRIKDRRAKRTLAAYAAAVNFCWNYLNEVQRRIESRNKAGGQTKRWPSAFDYHKMTAGSAALLGLNSYSIEAVCERFVQARAAASRPLRWRSSGGSRRSLGWIPFKKLGRQLVEGGVTYRGATFRYFGSKKRPLPPTATSGAFVEDARGRWWVTFSVPVEELPTGQGQVGIDLGLKTLATCSDGQAIPALQHYRHHEAKLANAQRGGNRRRVRAIHDRIANCRRDQIHKATTKIASENRLIAVGNVSSLKLAKTGMAKSVLDASWGMFRAQLDYKARRHRAAFHVVDEANTSRTCSACGTIPASSPKGMGALGMRSWTCDDCQTPHDRDVNAARNILRIALGAERHADENRSAARRRVGAIKGISRASAPSPIGEA